MSAEERRLRVLVVGSGWAGLQFTRRLDRKRFDVTVVSARDHFVFTPLLASTTVGTLEFRAIIEPIRVIPDLTFYEAKVTNIDAANKMVTCRDSTVGDVAETEDIDPIFHVEYDYLVLAPGAKSQTFGIPGVVENAMFLKQIADARRIRQRIMRCLERASQPQAKQSEIDRLLSFIIVGGGPTSIEFAAELYDFVHEDVGKWYPLTIANKIQIIVLEAGPTILGSFDQKLAKFTLGLFKRRNIEIRTGVQIKEVFKNRIELKDGSAIPSGLIVWSTGITPTKLIKKVDWPKDPKSGRLLVSDHLGVVGVNNVYSLGDCAVNLSSPKPPTAQVAQQQGAFLAQYFNNSTVDGPSTEQDNTTPGFVYKHFASLAYVGGWNAIADSPKVKSSGVGAWLFWRSAYWTTNVSVRNKILIPMYWFKAWVFGRDISSF